MNATLCEDQDGALTAAAPDVLAAIPARWQNGPHLLRRGCAFPISELRITTGLTTGLLALGVAWLVRDQAAARLWPHLVLGFVLLSSIAMWVSDPSEFRRDNLDFVARQALLVVLFQGVLLFVAGRWLRASPYEVLGTLCWVVAVVPVVVGAVTGALALVTRRRGS